MALIFSLSAECGESHEISKVFAKHFEDLLLTLSDDIKVRCSASVFKDSENNWWSVICPQGVCAGRLDCNPNLCDAKHTSEMGFLLYEHLKSAPDFRFAIVGWEADEFRYESQLDEADLSLFDGLVISQEFYERLGNSTVLELFAQSYYWRPYKGEKR